MRRLAPVGAAPAWLALARVSAGAPAAVQALPAGPFDLILGRNLAFPYFESDLQRASLGGLVKRLVPAEALLVGSHEALPEPAAVVPSAGTPGLYRASNEAA